MSKLNEVFFVYHGRCDCIYMQVRGIFQYLKKHVEVRTPIVLVKFLKEVLEKNDAVSISGDCIY